MCQLIFLLYLKGSDPAGMETRAKKQSDGSFILNGSKNCKNHLVI